MLMIATSDRNILVKKIHSPAEMNVNTNQFILEIETRHLKGIFTPKLPQH